MWTASSSRLSPPTSPVTDLARLKKNGCGTDAVSEIGVECENRVTPTPTPMLRQIDTPAEMFNAGPESTLYSVVNVPFSAFSTKETVSPKSSPPV